MANGRSVLITGAAGGIGALITDRFLADGDTVFASDSSKTALDRLLATRGTDRLITAQTDITSEEDLDALANLVRDRAGSLDVIINAAGYFPIVAFEDMTVEQWREVIDINLTGTFLLTRALLPLMRDGGRGRIINFGSGSVFDGTARQSHYVAAKAGVVGFSRSLARELGRYGITVNVVTPGLTATPAVRDSFPAEILAAQRKGRALQRDEEPQDLVGVVAFLASEDAAFISGQTLNVDGGKHMY
jgi:NAD(P)-dependent dehydrogenase (short-subunit alcohol dehydrogenase family)